MTGVDMTVRRGIGFGRQPMSALTHFVGLLVAIVGLVVLVALSHHDGPKVAGMAVYGGSLVAVFLASSLYHFLDLGTRGNRWLRRLDHSAIFLLIAGTYMPALIHLLDGPWRTTMIAVVGGLALLGVALKMTWISCPNWLSATIYLILGWVILIPSPLIFPQLAGPELLWLGLGGVAYSLGAVIWLKRWPDPWPSFFGFHEIWHLFVLLGAGSHFIFTYSFLGVAYPTF